MLFNDGQKRGGWFRVFRVRPPEMLFNDERGKSLNGEESAKFPWTKTKSGGTLPTPMAWAKPWWSKLTRSFVPCGERRKVELELVAKVVTKLGTLLKWVAVRWAKVSAPVSKER